jgi:hypothetical protein
MLTGPMKTDLDNTIVPAARGMESPIFFVGTPRSGTSLISRIIGSHPRIAVPFESYFYKSFAGWRRHYGDLGKRTNRDRLLRDFLQSVRLRVWVPRVDGQTASERIEATGQFDFSGVIAGIMGAWSSAQGKERWGEKTPAHIFFANEILAGFPKAQFIHIVRDGRDVTESWKHVRFGPKHVFSSASRWVETLEAGRRLRETLGPTQYLELRYEDLLADTEKVVQRVCDFLDETYTSEMLNFYRSQAKYPTDARNEANLAKPVIVDNVEKWRQSLSPREIRIFEAVAGDKLEEYNYVRTCHKPRLSELERMFCKYLEHPARKIVPMAMNRQSQLDALVRGMIYLRLRAGL